MKQVVDLKSIGCMIATFFGAWISVFVKTELVFIITMLVGISTVVYNLIRIYKDLKEKK